MVAESEVESRVGWVSSETGEGCVGVSGFLSGTSVRIEVSKEETGTGGVCGVVGGESRKESVIEGVDGVETKG